MIATRTRISVSLVAIAAFHVFLVHGCAHGPRSPEHGLRGAQSALERGDTATAIALLEKHTRDCEAIPMAYVRLGEIFRLRGTILDRLLSQQILEEGVRKHPDDPDLLVELGKTYYQQSFYGDAERTFSRVLSIDPGRCEAHEYLGANAFRNWKYVQPYTEYLTAAVDHLRHAVDCASESEESYLKLAVSAYVLGDTAFALGTCEAYRDRHPDAPEPLFLMGAVAFDKRRWEECSACFRMALSLVPEDEQTHYLDVGHLLSSQQEAGRYEEATPAEKQVLQRVYWLEHDPDPTTEINQRLLEHVYRVFLSDMRFASTTPPLRGWETERGKAFIKFGTPTHIRTTLQGTRPWDGRMEVWTYLGPHAAFNLWFRNEYLNGNYIVPIDDEISARTLLEDPPRTGMVGDSVPLPGVIDVIAFRDSDVSSSIYLSFALNDDTLQHHLRTWDVDTFVSRDAFFGEDGNPRANYSHTIAADSIPCQALPTGRSRHVLDKHELPFDSYRLAFSFEDERGLIASHAWSSTNTSRFHGGSLVLSDILLHTTPTSGAGPFVERFGKRYFSNPQCRYAPSEKLRLYVEIYNLSVLGGAASFEVTYSIHAADTTTSRWRRIGRRITHALGVGTATEPVISQSFRRTGVSDVAAEELAIDVDSLEPGAYIVNISVVDGASGQRVARSKQFVKFVAAARAKYN